LWYGQKTWTIGGRYEKSINKNNRFINPQDKPGFKYAVVDFFKYYIILLLDVDGANKVHAMQQSRPT